MGWSIVVLVLLVAAGSAALVFYIRSQQQASRAGAGAKHPRKTSKSGARRPQVERNPFRATSIHIGENACAAAQSLETDRFLVENGEIPRLPLAQCDRVDECRCTYTKHNDRRNEFNERRALGGGVREGERRSGQERRS